MKRRVIVNILAVNILFALISFSKISGQTIRAPIDAQVDLIPKILALDKNFNPSYERRICNIGIIYNSQQKSSSEVKERIMWYWSRKEINIKNSENRMIPLDISEITNFRETFDKNKIKAVYIAPLDNYDISPLTRICKDKKIRTFTGVDSFFTSDISVMFDMNDYETHISINLSSARGEDIDFSAYLLNIAELIE